VLILILGGNVEVKEQIHQRIRDNQSLIIDKIACAMSISHVCRMKGAVQEWFKAQRNGFYCNAVRKLVDRTNALKGRLIYQTIV
jgi:hypothetical protein